MAGAGFKIRHDDAIFLRDRSFDQDIVGKLWLDAYLNSFWKKLRQGVILVVEVQDQWRETFLLKVGNQEPCRRGLAGTAFGAGCENESAGHALSSLFAFEFGQPFSHLFGSEALEVVFSAGGKGLQLSPTRVLAKRRVGTPGKARDRVIRYCFGTNWKCRRRFDWR
jgi:hypothetical protein